MCALTASKNTPADWADTDPTGQECFSMFRSLPPCLRLPGCEGISTHSFRKRYATEIYNAHGFDIALVQRLLQHSSATTTQRYIGIEPQKIEQAIQNHAQLV